MTRLRQALDGRISVLIGQSGSRRSRTLVNALVPDAGRAVGVVNAVTGQGAAHVVVRDRAAAPAVRESRADDPAG